MSKAILKDKMIKRTKNQASKPWPTQDLSQVQWQFEDNFGW
jgi:hypothetical protein